MKKFIIAASVGLALSGCTSTQQADQKFDSYAPERQAYYSCGYKAGAYFKKRSPSADYRLLINSSRSYCGAERSALITKITKVYNYSIWQKLIAVMDQKFDEAVSAGAVS